MGLFSAIAKVGKVIGKTVEVGKRIGGFIAKHHQTLAPLAHGLAMASGNAVGAYGLHGDVNPQRITGAGLAASQAASVGKPVLSAVGDYAHKVVSDRIAAMRAHHAAPPRPPPGHFERS